MVLWGGVSSLVGVPFLECNILKSRTIFGSPQMTMNCVQSRAYSRARREARDAGLDKESEYAAGSLAHQMAKEELERNQSESSNMD